MLPELVMSLGRTEGLEKTDVYKRQVPRLIDEWQLAPKLWDTVRFEVDHRGELGQFILCLLYTSRCV